MLTILDLGVPQVVEFTVEVSETASSLLVVSLQPFQIISLPQKVGVH